MTQPIDSGVRKRVCILGLGGGGFHLETERLLAQGGADIELVLVYTIRAQSSANWGSPFPVHRAFVVRSPGLNLDNRLLRGWNFLLSLWFALWILLASRPDCIVAVGTAQAIPFGAIARLLRIPLFFVESITRVDRPSRTGKLVGHLHLATGHYVQWPELSLKYPGTAFAGSVIS
jgi:UDP-N-acetylglucosamine:LPS N-acetylglucosamine transferase